MFQKPEWKKIKLKCGFLYADSTAFWLWPAWPKHFIMYPLNFVNKNATCIWGLWRICLVALSYGKVVAVVKLILNILAFLLQNHPCQTLGHSGLLSWRSQWTEWDFHIGFCFLRSPVFSGNLKEMVFFYAFPVFSEGHEVTLHAQINICRYLERIFLENNYIKIYRIGLLFEERSNSWIKLFEIYFKRELIQFNNFYLLHRLSVQSYTGNPFWRHLAPLLSVRCPSTVLDIST